MSKLRIIVLTLSLTSSVSVYSQGVALTKLLRNPLVSHIVAPYTTKLCGVEKKPKGELQKLIDASIELNCQNEKDIYKHCGCILVLAAENSPT